MKRLLLLGAFLLLSASAAAAPPDPPWYWYYADFGGQVDEPGHAMSVESRYGLASVRISKSNITIVFDEPAVPEDRPKFTGHIARNGAIVGNLPDFFGGDAPGPGRVVGQYRKARLPGCWVEDIRFRQTFPTFDTWVLYRQHGTCMPNDYVNDEPPLAR